MSASPAVDSIVTPPVILAGGSLAEQWAQGRIEVVAGSGVCPPRRRPAMFAECPDVPCPVDALFIAEDEPELLDLIARHLQDVTHHREGSSP